VDLSYDVPFKFTGSIAKVVIDLKPMETATAGESEKRQQGAAAAIAAQQ
jgi:hypothetical protein